MSVEPTRIGRAAAQPTGLKLAVHRGSVGISVGSDLVDDSGTRGLPLHAYVCSIQPSGHGPDGQEGQITDVLLYLSRSAVESSNSL